MEDQVPIATLVLFGTAALLSMASLFYLFQKHIDGRALLRYQPRQSVPWGAAVAAIAVSMPLANVLVFLSTPQAPNAAGSPVVATERENSEAADQPNNELHTADAEDIHGQVVNAWGTFTFMFAFVFGIGTLIVAIYQADATDLGLPTSWAQALQDIGTGVLATLAALLPVYAVQLFLVTALEEKTKHPLVEQLEANPSSAMLLVGFAMAVIGAPLFEEFTFRCLLQGWLEKVEDAVTGYVATERPTGQELLRFEKATAPTAHDPTADDQTAPVAATFSNTPPSGTPNSLPVHGLIPALPHGWTPILISGTVFGLAHLGHGVAPISLILFGIVLAYLYQRTHRLLPCITAHMVFNAYSMLQLWLQIGG